MGEGGIRLRLVDWGGILGNFVDQISVRRAVEIGAWSVLCGDVEGAQDELGAAEVDGVAHEGVDDFHERDLDRLLVLKERHGMEARLGRRAHAADEALVDIAEGFAAKGGRAAANSIDFDVRAEACGLVECH